MHLFCCQFDLTWENKPANFAKVDGLLRNAAIPPGSLVLLPEMFSTGFSMNVTGIREGTPSETEGFLARVASDLGLFLAGGVVTMTPDGRGQNQAVVFSPEGRVIARYTKMQPFSLSGESQHFTAGEEMVTFRWQDCLVAPFICYDLRFPELFRAAVRRGAQLFLILANWPAARIRHWRILLQARAIENQACVAGVNRCGNDPVNSYNGHSLILGPRGEILAEAGDAEGVIGADLQVADLMAYRSEFPILKDMRADT